MKTVEGQHQIEAVVPEGQFPHITLPELHIAHSRRFCAPQTARPGKVEQVIMPS